MRAIPERFRVPCAFCGDVLDMRAKGVYAKKIGWVRNRKEGGGNALALPHTLGEYACGLCMERETAGAAKWQMNLFSS